MDAGHLLVQVSWQGIGGREELEQDRGLNRAVTGFRAGWIRPERRVGSVTVRAES